MSDYFGIGCFIAMQKIGLFGGTFDPIHVGHIAIAQQFMEELSLNEVFLLPAGKPYHKDRQTVSAEHRVQMCLLATEKMAGLSVSDVDVLRDKDTYTYDTVQIFKHYDQRAEWWWLMGSDALRQFHRWYRFRDILREINLAIFWRDDDALDQLPEATKQWLMPVLQAASAHNSHGQIRFLSGNPIDMSSTQIRQSLAKKENVEQWLDTQVFDYIQQHHLYQEKYGK